MCRQKIQSLLEKPSTSLAKSDSNGPQEDPDRPEAGEGVQAVPQEKNRQKHRLFYCLNECKNSYFLPFPLKVPYKQTKQANHLQAMLMRLHNTMKSAFSVTKGQIEKTIQLMVEIGAKHIAK